MTAPNQSSGDYRAEQRVLASKGGRIIKFMGDGCLVTFAADAAGAALLGRGPGIRISEPVYRQLPNESRGPWQKHKPPAIYRLSASSGILEGLGKDAGSNTDRW